MKKFIVSLMLAIVLMPLITMAEHRLKFENRSSKVITDIDGSGVEERFWAGGGALGNTVIAPGEHFWLTVITGSTRKDCFFDFKIVFADGQVLHRCKHNICDQKILFVETVADLPGFSSSCKRKLPPPE